MLNITIDKVRHIEDKDANVRETLVELQHALDKSEQERHFYDALCIDYTAAYLCDLMADTMTVIKNMLHGRFSLLFLLAFRIYSWQMTSKLCPRFLNTLLNLEFLW